ncbi:Vitamin B12 import ATP-binding protein BtuD [Streptomyces tanashiensis]
MAEYIYTMRKARKAHGDKVILDDVTLSFLPGAKIGVVGPNGAGKSTVLKIMAGLEQPSNGDAFLSPGFSVGILMQEPKLDETKTVLENVEDGVAEIKGKLNRFNAIAEEMATNYTDELMEEMGKLQDDLDHSNAWDLDAQLEQAMDALGCPPGDWAVNNLSGGEKRRVALCKLLLEAPDLLLLDEPTNHLDAESVNWLEQHLAQYKGTVVAITHDRYFLDNVAEWILELDRGRAHPYEGNYSTYLTKKSERLKVEGQKDAKRAKRLKEELEWVRSNAKGRQAKSKARLARYEEMAAEADKMRKLDFEEIQIPPGPRLGSIVVEVENLSKAFGDKVLIDDLSFTLPRNGIVGVIGPNGAGNGSSDTSNVVGDGGVHAFLLDTTVHPEERRRGLGVDPRTGRRRGRPRARRGLAARGLRAAPHRLPRAVRFPPHGGRPHGARRSGEGRPGEGRPGEGRPGRLSGRLTRRAPAVAADSVSTASEAGSHGEVDPSTAGSTRRRGS